MKNLYDKSVASIESNKEHNHFKSIINFIEPKDGALSGMTFGIKDNVWYKGIACEAGSNGLAGFIPQEHATIVERLISHGAIPVGKTNLDEFGMGGTGLLSCEGIVLNAVDKTRLVGGSSSGSVAAVALGDVSFAIGTDTGDSIRKPASYNGVVGFKPTYGLISRNGVMAYDPSYDTVGFFAKSVSDMSKLMDVAQWFDKNDSTCANIEKQTYSDKVNDSIKGTKFVVYNELYNQFSTEYKDQFDTLIEKIKAQGATVDFIDFGRELLAAVYSVYQTITFATASSQLAAIDGINYGSRVEGDNPVDTMLKSRTAGFGDYIKRRLSVGGWMLFEENQEKQLMQAKKVRTLIINRVSEIFKEYDVAINIASLIAPKIEGYKNKMDHIIEFEDALQVANHAGTPSITFPIGTVEDMPFSIEVTSGIFSDAKVLNVANTIEGIIGGAK